MSYRYRSVRSSAQLISGVVFSFTFMWLAALFASPLLPALTITSLISNQTVSGMVPLAATASGSGLSALQFQVSGQNVGPLITAGACSTSWDSTKSPNGIYTVTAVGVDSVGASTVSLPLLINVRNEAPADRAAPSVSISAPASAAVVSGTVSFAASASDNLAVSSVWFTVDGVTVGAEDTAAPYGISWPSTSVANGSHVIAAFARDAAGNVASSATVWVTVNNVTRDAVAPTVSVTAPTSGTTVSGSVALSATAADDVGVTSVQFTVDGASVAQPDTASPYSVTWNSTAVSNGSHTVRAIARDAAGNVTTSAPVTFSVSNGSSTPTPPPTAPDPTPAPAPSPEPPPTSPTSPTQPTQPADTTRPNLTITSPGSWRTVRGQTTIRASASDNIAVTSVIFAVDGRTIATVTSGAWETVWDTTRVSEGYHVIHVVARDAAGNSRAASVFVKVDNR